MEVNTAKGIGLLIFFLVSMIPGSLPILLFYRCQHSMTSSRRGRALLSLIRCFAGGVFLGTCLLGLLVEGLEEYEEYKETAGFEEEYPFFHLGIAVGLFMVALVERFAVMVSSGSHQGAAESGKSGEDGGEVSVISMSTLSHTEDAGLSGAARPHEGETAKGVPLRPITDDSQQADQEKQAGPPGEDGAARLSGHNGVRAIVILLALSFHTIFDGLAVGLQDEERDVWTTTIAITIHKTIVSVSLGMELSAGVKGRSSLRAILLLFLFAIMAPVGVAVGMGVTSSHVDMRAHLLAGGVLQAVATGSFLYVTFFEMLGVELGQRATVARIAVTALGFGAMAVAKIWDTD